MPIPANHSSQKRVTAKENAFNQLQQWIIEGTLLPGEKLNDSELAMALGVSRTPIRESLQLLEAQGFVKMYPGKATQVTEIEKKSIKDLLPPLGVLQALAGELAIPHLTDKIMQELKETNARFAEAIRSENFFSALRMDEKFHQIIVDTADNPYIHSMLATLHAHVRRQFYHNSIALTERSIKDHETIIDCLTEHDTELLQSTMKKNWLRTLEIKPFNMI